MLKEADLQACALPLPQEEGEQGRRCVGSEAQCAGGEVLLQNGWIQSVPDKALLDPIAPDQHVSNGRHGLLYELLAIQRPLLQPVRERAAKGQSVSRLRQGVENPWQSRRCTRGAAIRRSHRGNLAIQQHLLKADAHVLPIPRVLQGEARQHELAYAA